MKNKANPLKTTKRFTKTILVLVMLIILVSILLLIFSASSGKKSDVTYRNHGINGFLKKGRHFSIESSQENIYNLGDYNVNLGPRRLLILNISVKCKQESFEDLTDYAIPVQNAVLEAFADYSSLQRATSIKGKEKIKKNILENINSSMPEPIIKQVYFNKFIIQETFH